MTEVADSVLQRLSEWGVRRVYGCPGDGTIGLPGAFDRADGDPEFIQAGHEETAASTPCAHAEFTGDAGCCIATSGPGAGHLLNGLYDAELDHRPVVAVVGRRKTLSPGTPYQQEDEALAADRPVVLECKVDAETAPIPPHIVKEQGEKAVKAAPHDPELTGIATKGVRHKPTEYAEHLPGRGKK
ncbi:thiamine pyrophosphate-binding protein [Streptomyces sp. NPDC017890]|uniref:thiamine pyrophosphate-binding protein n=1 Tax=Streptomyces sp. NPDC017890 TaxID=3365015 RepID=UPI0037A68F9A